jgi:glycosyltransferase involved in cell wall biosynthesis
MILVDIAKRLTGSTTPVVFTQQEGEVLDVDDRTRTWHPTSRLRHSMRVKHFAARRADFVIFVSRQLAAVLPIDKPQGVIPCGVDLDKFRPLDRSECRRQLGLATDTLVIFFPGTPAKKFKRFELARQAYELVRREIPDSLIVTGGGIHADAMPLYYNAANVMLQTSFYEASPTVVKEALACEVPVVSTDVGDTREIIHGVPHCFVCAEDARELANRILEANGSRAVGGRAHLLQRGLGLNQVAQRVIEVYDWVLSRQSENGYDHTL